jgi:uncharacterized membrane protein YkoI
MTRKLKGIIAAGAALVALALGGAALAGASSGGGDDSEKAISGNALDQASAAALAHTGGGKVTDTEVGDEEGYYEVEVTRADGSQVDVHLSQDFKVLSQVSDEEHAGDKADGGEK